MTNILQLLASVESTLSDMPEMDTVVLTQQYAVFRSAATYLIETGALQPESLPQLQQAMDTIAADMELQRYEDAILLLLITTHQLQFGVSQLMAGHKWVNDAG